MQALGAREALRYHNGYRTWKITYRELHQRIGRFARLFETAKAFGKETACCCGAKIAPSGFMFSGRAWREESKLSRSTTVFHRNWCKEFSKRSTRNCSSPATKWTPRSLEMERISYAAVAEISCEPGGADSSLETAAVNAMTSSKSSTPRARRGSPKASFTATATSRPT